jgi:NAD(P)-dependent dehydrogenase (short-subunit alcohol dehydrogenase family)
VTFASLEGRTALVTGGSRGIGRAIAEELARAGASVVVGYRSGADEAEEVAAAIGGRTVQADISDPEQAKSLVEEAGDLEAGDAELGRDLALGSAVEEIAARREHGAHDIASRAGSLCLNQRSHSRHVQRPIPPGRRARATVGIVRAARSSSKRSNERTGAGDSTDGAVAPPSRRGVG